MTDLQQYCQATATEKARFTAKQVFGSGEKPALVVGSDTVVDIDGRILEKPANEEVTYFSVTLGTRLIMRKAAHSMLRSLSGRSHLVHSGVCVFSEANGVDTPLLAFAETTTVTFGDLTDEDIDAYIATGEPMDKAGGYGIQGFGGQLVDRIDGCYFNVMGFPMRRFSIALASTLST